MKSTLTSFSLNNIMGNLSESTEINVSEEASNSYESLQRYQNETQTIQSILNSLYQQIDKSISPSSSKNESPKNIIISCDLIKEIQQRLKTLEEENEQLTIQMKKFADISDVSSIKSRKNTTAFSDIQQFNEVSPAKNMRNHSNEKLNSCTNSKLNIGQNNNLSYQSANYSYIISKNHSLEKENTRLKTDLYEQIKLNNLLQNQQTQILHNLLEITGQSSDPNGDIYEQINKTVRFLAYHFGHCSIKNESLKHIKSIAAKEKQEIIQILNTYKDEFFKLRFNCLQKIQQFSRFPSEFPLRVHAKQQASIYRSSNQSQNDSKSKPDTFCYSSHQEQSTTITNLIRGLEEILDSITNNFSDIEKKSIKDIINNPKVFGRYISETRLGLDKNIQSIKDENYILSNNLSLAKRKIKSSRISPNIQNVLNNVMVNINKVSNDMKYQHQKFIDNLAE